MSTERVQNAHIKESLPVLLSSLIEITGAMNGPERDAAMLEASGLAMERALCPLLVLVGHLGPIGIVDLASRIGRDYSTVSRQVARLEELGLLTRRTNPADKRIKEAVIAPAGKVATDAIDAARLEVAKTLFRDWTEKDFSELVRLNKQLADKLTGGKPGD